MPAGPGSIATRSMRSGRCGTGVPSGRARRRGTNPGPAHRRTLPMVQRLLREPEVPAASPPHLHHHQCRRRPRIHRHQIDLVPSDAELPRKDAPAGRDQSYLRRRSPASPIRCPRLDGAVSPLMRHPRQHARVRSPGAYRTVSPPRGGGIPRARSSKLRPGTMSTWWRR